MKKKQLSKTLSYEGENECEPFKLSPLTYWVVRKWVDTVRTACHDEHGLYRTFLSSADSHNLATSPVQTAITYSALARSKITYTLYTTVRYTRFLYDLFHRNRYTEFCVTLYIFTTYLTSCVQFAPDGFVVVFEAKLLYEGYEKNEFPRSEDCSRHQSR